MTEGGSQQFALYLCTTAHSPTETPALPIHHVLILRVDSLNKEKDEVINFRPISFSLQMCIDRHTPTETA